MGIPGLTSHLSPYAIPTILGCDHLGCQIHSPGLNQQNNKLIIDGPSFAYEVYNRLVANKPSYLDALDRVPSYSEIVKSALGLLDELERCGLFVYELELPSITKIYFDGFLPPHKHTIRISRLNKLIERLITSRTIHNNGFQITNQSPPNHQTDLSILSSPSYPHSARGLPEPPFLVPANIEALTHSKHASITSVVPGEADAYCAQAVREGGGTILTNDSDLLIYDLGPHGAVGSLHQLTISIAEIKKGISCQTVQTMVTKPQDIARQLGLENLHSLAYVLKTSQHTFKEALKHAKNHPSTPLQISAHLSEYTTPPSIFERMHIHPLILPHFLTHLPPLDPRLSELILTYHTEDPTIYLPLPLDSPNHTSSFTPSTSLRTITYSLLTLLPLSQPHPHNPPTPKKFIEFTRHAHSIHPTPIPLLPPPQLLTHIQALTSTIQTHTSTFSSFNLPSALLWRVWALREVYIWHLDTSRTPPDEKTMLAALVGRSRKVDWEMVHLKAQIEGWLYSVRMLGQVLGFVLGVRGADNEPIDEPPSSYTHVVDTMTKLSNKLQDLPPLADLMPNFAELKSTTANVDAEALLDRLAVVLCEEVNEERNGVSQAMKEEEGREIGDGEILTMEKKKKKRKQKKVRG